MGAILQSSSPTSKFNEKKIKGKHFYLGLSTKWMGSPGGNLLAVQEMQEMCVQSLGWEDPLGEGSATHSSILAWRIPRREELGELQSMGL